MILSDYTVIHGNNPIHFHGSYTFETDFNTGGRHKSDAVLMFNVKGLINAANPVRIEINDGEFFEIDKYFPAASYPDREDLILSEIDYLSHWYTQMITFDGSILSSGNGPRNHFRIENVAAVGGSGNDWARFYMKNIICMFKQDTR